MPDSAITFLTGADFYSLLGGDGPGDFGWRAVVAARRERLEARLKKEMEEYTLWRITNRRMNATSSQSDLTRQLWLASRSTAIGTREAGGERARALLESLALPQPKNWPDFEEQLLTEVCLEVAVTILLLTRVWSHSLWTKGGAIWSPLAHSVVIDSVAADEMPDLEAFGWLISDNRQRKVLDGWLGYQAALVMEGIELLVAPPDGSRPILSQDESRGLRMRFAKLCCDAVSASATDTIGGPIEVPEYRDDREQRGDRIGGPDGKITPMGPKDFIREAGVAVSQGGYPPPTGLTASHIEWLTSVLRYLLLKGSGAPRTRSDLASAIAFLPPGGSASVLVSPRRLHAATTLSGVCESKRSSRGGLQAAQENVVAHELRAMLGERCAKDAGGSGCVCRVECGPVDDRRGDLAWALIGAVTEAGKPQSPNCLITTTYDRVIMCALDDIGLPYRVIVPADAEYPMGSKPEWLMGQFSGATTRRWWCVEGLYEVDAKTGEAFGEPWGDQGLLGNDESYTQRLPLLPGEGPVIIPLMGSPMLDLPDRWEHRIALGEMSLHQQFLFMGPVMKGLLKEVLGETSSGEKRKLVLLGLSGWSHTDRHSLIWLYTHVAREAKADSMQVWSSEHSLEPSMLYRELLQSEPLPGGQLMQVQNWANDARTSRQVAGGRAR